MNRAALPMMIPVLVLAAASAAARAEGLWAPKSSGGRDLLKAAQAFHLVSAERHGASLKIDWDVAPGYYLYRKRLGFHVVAPAEVKLQPPQLPAGEMVEDEQGKSEVYRGSLQAVLRWSGSAPPQQLRIDFQGCAEAGVCYPPQSQLIDVVDLGG